MQKKQASPNVFLWIWYAWGGRLPQRYREWVLHDLTSRAWLVRHIARALVFVLTALIVVFVVVLFAHAQLWIALAAVPLGLIVGVYYSVSYAWESADVKLVKYGYPGGYGTQLREEMEQERNKATADLYDQQWRKPESGSTVEG